MKDTVRLVALALAVTAPLALAGTAMASGDTGSISGVVWHDLNSNGLREAGEPAIKGHYLLIEGANTVAQTNAEGRYTFKNLAPGSYVVASASRLGAGQSWTTRQGAQFGSDFRSDNGKLWSPAELKAGEQLQLDSGFTTARVGAPTS